MDKELKKIIEDNTDLIDADKFDELFNKCNIGEKILLAECFLEAGIDFTNPEQPKKFKIPHISKFINDLRIDKSSIYIKKGPIQTVTYEVEPDKYAMYLREETVRKLPELLSKRYKISKIEQALKYSRYSYPNMNYITILVFDI